MQNQNAQNTELLAKLMVEFLKSSPELMSEFVKAAGVNSEPVEAEKPKAKKPKHAKSKAEKPEATETKWYDRFRTDVTEVSVKDATVQVKVKRGHGREWHDELRAAGFKWSRKGFWWAHLDDEKRAERAARNIAIDQATAGMTDEEKRAFWAARRANRAA